MVTSWSPGRRWDRSTLLRNNDRPVALVRAHTREHALLQSPRSSPLITLETSHHRERIRTYR
jgi:hypothetical protein